MATKFMLSEDAIIDLQEWSLNPLGFAVLQGKNGRGKSHIARTIYAQNTPYAFPSYDHDLAWFINQADLNMLFQEAYEKFGNAVGLLRKACATKLLVLDDLGTRTPTDAFMDFLYAILDRRYNERSTLGTIITTNLTSEKLREQFSDAIFSRIASGRNYVITGDDRRFNNLGF